MYGAPINQGIPAAIGITHINRLAVEGPLSASDAKLPIAIAHGPGRVFVSDTRKEEPLLFSERER